MTSPQIVASASRMVEAFRALGDDRRFPCFVCGADPIWHNGSELAAHIVACTRIANALAPVRAPAAGVAL